MTGPYKSKLFNFLNRQSLNLGDKFSHAVRQMKVAAEWGVQILIYPIYLLVQAGRMAGYQLKQRSQQQLLSEDSLASVPEETTIVINSDRLIKVILQEIEPWLSPTETPESLPELPIPSLVELNANLQPSGKLVESLQTSPVLAIQGVANSLESRSLVLVTPDNQTLDILSAEQQQQLQQRIRTEIANYYYLQKLQQNAAQQFSGLIPTFTTESDRILPPIRWFWKTMRWVQTSQLATTLNLFAESSLVYREMPVTQALSLPNTPVETVPILWVKLDQSLAELEVLNETATLAEVLQKGLQRWLQGLQGAWNNDSSLNPSEPDPFQIQAIIQAAIDYFFGQSSSKFKLSNSQYHKVLAGDELRIPGNLTGQSPSPKPLLAAADDDPWLSWDDLFTDATFSSFPVSPASPALPSASQSPQPPQNSLSETLKRNLRQEKTPKALRIRQENAKQLVKPIDENLEVNDSQIGSIENLIPPTSQTTNSEASSNSPPFQGGIKGESPFQGGIKEKLGDEKEITGELYKIQNQQNDSDILSIQNPIPPTPLGKGGQSKIQNLEEDWIETEAKPLGYVKHPLEIVLEWLDRVILWLEEAIVQVWSWLRQRIKRKRKKLK